MDKNNESYVEQNQALSEAYHERRNREIHANIPKEIRSQNLDKDTPKEEPQSKPELKLYLNHLIYDPRDKKPSHYLRIHRYFNQDPTQEKGGFDSAKRIKSIFMTTFGFETQMLSDIAGIGCNLVVVNDSDKYITSYLHEYSGFKNWTVINLQKKRGGVFHTKLWLIKFQSFLRVVVSTANMHVLDWASWSNANWYQDFRLKNLSELQQPVTTESNLSDLNQDFYSTLKICLNSMIPEKDFEEKVQIKLEDYLFENVNVVLIPSLPGKYNKQEAVKFGLKKVEKALKHFSSKGKIQLKNPVLTINSSSVGALDRKFLEDFYSSFTLSKFSYDKFRLVFPSHHYATQTMQGHWGCLFHNANYLEKHPEATKLYHHISENPLNPNGAISPHLKTVLIESQNTNKVVFYVGSHNISKAAWGTELKSGDISINNSELGVLFIDSTIEEVKKWLPFKYPPDKYDNKETAFNRFVQE